MDDRQHTVETACSAASGSEADAPKRPYRAPELIIHGTVEKLTATFGLKGGDSIGGHGSGSL